MLKTALNNSRFAVEQMTCQNK